MGRPDGSPHAQTYGASLVTRPKALRSTLIAAALMALGAVAWLLFAPTRLGGSTDYVSTHGDSMAPRFRTGDLALLRPAGRYRVGDVAAYRSSLLHTVVLHRIVAREGDRYVFKGDNNDFLDPVRPRGTALVGRLWLRVPRGGVVLAWLHVPIVAAVLTAGAALLLLSGGRRRRRRDPHPGERPVTHLPPLARRIDVRRMATGSVAVAAAFLALAALAFTRPENKPVTVRTPYTEKVAFGYHATAAGAGPVYPGGTLTTGDPVFLRLVPRVRVSAGYRLATTARHRLTGTIEMVARLTAATGWSRDIEVSPPTRFAGDRAHAEATLDLPRLRSLTRRVEALTGAPAGGDYTLAVVPRVHVAGMLDGEPMHSDFAPALSFQLSALQLRPGAPTAGSDGEQDGLAPSRRGTVAVRGTAPNRLTALGHGVPVATVRRIALYGLLAAACGLLLASLARIRRGPDPAAEIRARYGRMIVPVAGAVHNPARPPIDVTSIDALALLAERSERLILHHRCDEADSYLVDDEGTLYRYQVRLAA